MPESPVSAKPAIQVSTDSAVSMSACEVHREFIESSLARGRNAMAIWQDLVDAHGFTHAYASVRRFAAKLRTSPQKEACAIIVTAPGEEAQVDYGTGPMVRDPNTGKYRRTRLLVLTLGYSRKAVRLLTFTSSSRTWAELHEQAFARYGARSHGRTRQPARRRNQGGCLRSGTQSRVRGHAQHYGVTALPCRIRHPDRKGKVEASVGHAQKTPLKGMRFESLTKAQAYLDRWEERRADTRIHGTTKRQVAAMFAEEKPSLQPLPLEPFRYFEYGERTVHLDGCVEVEALLWRSTRLDRTPHSRAVERAVRPPARSAHRPTIARAHTGAAGSTASSKRTARPTQLGITKLLARTDGAGAHVGQFCRIMHGLKGETAVRRIQGVLSLARKYGVAAVEDACTVALNLNVFEYAFVRRYLERTPATPLTLRQVDPLIRQLTLYRDVIEQKAQEKTNECC